MLAITCVGNIATDQVVAVRVNRMFALNIIPFSTREKRERERKFLVLSSRRVVGGCRLQGWSGAGIVAAQRILQLGDSDQNLKI